MSIVAKDDKLLLKHGRRPALNHLSTPDLQAFFALVQRLLASIAFANQHCFQDEFSLCSGKETFLVDVDEIFMANLEYLLLCLQTDLLLALFRDGWDLVRKHVIEWQKEQSRRSKNWFSVFPDARHPLSTTWPWSIRPSLAVLWGVCWMFYDEIYYDTEGNWVDDDGRILISAETIDGNDLVFSGSCLTMHQALS